MKNLFIVLCLMLLGSISFAADQPAANAKKANEFASVPYTSKGPNDVITINNGMGGQYSSMLVFISVAGGYSQSGINIQNCTGKSVHLAANSSITCYVDINTPLTFSADSANGTNGFYQIK